MERFSFAHDRSQQELAECDTGESRRQSMYVSDGWGRIFFLPPKSTSVQ